MPFSSVLGANSVIRPGVCTSTTRPTVPYEGQLIYETDTDRVAAYNGSAWVYTHSSGLILVKAETSFSEASTVTANDVFTSTYTNYRVIVRYTTTGMLNAHGIFFQLGVGGVYAATNYNFQVLQALSTTVSTSRSTAQTSARFAGSTGGSYVSLAVMDISGPQLAAETNYQSVCTRNSTAFTDLQLEHYVGNHTTTTAYDGFQFLVSFGSMTGTYTIYGYAKS